ncbi:MAG: SMP-30/gluconolactonase/LRE family protein [Rhodomicrobium sp.]
MRRILLFILIIFAAVLAYLSLAPVGIEPVAWQPEPAPSAERGPYARNEILKAIELIAPGVGKGPEAVAFDAGGRIYTGFDDGRVARFEPDGSGYTLIANTGGRPLGVYIHPDGSVIVCDAQKGLLKIDQAGAVSVLSSTADNVPFRFPDDLAVTKDGSKVYFTDASSKFGYGYSTQDIFEHAGHGRFLVYDFHTGKTDVLLKGMQFSNGVALGPDEAFVLVNETGNYRIVRYWLKGEKAGTSDIFADNLPGFPDNITFNGSDRFWVAIYAPRTPIADRLAPYPYLRKMVMRALQFLPPPVKPQAYALAFNPDGKLAANLQYDGSDAYFPITSVREHPNGFLYFGSLTATSLGRMKLPGLPAGIGQ